MRACAGERDEGGDFAVKLENLATRFRAVPREEIAEMLRQVGPALPVSSRTVQQYTIPFPPIPSHPIPSHPIHRKACLH